MEAAAGVGRTRSRQRLLWVLESTKVPRLLILLKLTLVSDEGEGHSHRLRSEAAREGRAEKGASADGLLTRTDSR